MSEDYRDREGKITYGSNTVRLRLADTPNPYRPLRITPAFEGGITGDEPAASGDRFIRRWSMSNWEQGELGGKWKPGGYRLSSNVRPDKIGDKLVLGAYRETIQNDAAADFGDCLKFIRAHGGLYATGTTNDQAHLWSLVNQNFPGTGWGTGATTAVPTSGCDFGDGSNLLIGYSDKSIRKVASGANSEQFAAGGASFAPELRSFQSVVYYLDGPNLYELSTGATDTRTALSTPGDRVTAYMASSGNVYRRMCVTDTGVAWVNPDDDGNSTVYEYNAKNQTDFASGRIPVEGAFPYSTLFAHGFIFVAFRYASAHNQVGPAQIYFQRGGQRGTTPEIRLSESSSASQPVILAGVIGDDLIFYYSKAIYAYDLSAGALYQIAAAGAGSPTAITDAITFGKDIFIANTDNSEEGERFVTSIYSTDTATWRSGRFTFDYPAVKKTLYRVGVVHDPLPANTSLTLKVAADGGSFASVTGTDDTDNATTFTWTVSSSGAAANQITGYDFELELTFASTTSASTPTIREIFAEVGPAQKRRGGEIDVEVAGTEMIGSGASTQLLSQLLAATEYTGGVVKLTDPWGVADTAAATAREVMIEVLAGAPEKGVATLRWFEIGVV